MLYDRSVLQLAPSSTIVINRYVVGRDRTAHTRIGLLGGFLRSIVGKGAAGISHEDYWVTTPTAVAAARGTIYSVDYQQGVKRKGYGACTQFTDVSVEQGTVVVSNSTNPSAGSVNVSKGQKTTVACGLAPLAPSSTLSLLGYGAGGVAVAGGLAGGIYGALLPPDQHPKSPSF